ncbi:class I SAM-dependent methyltransferase [Aureliella helgolandensis]|uniref:THUMP-like domain-containing protein n=1 Tax=Aureliella helgolandensis TaxID=2527968 RepID=A0A518G6P2_9BACT|nr:class I SAM-dependent methyltransferase [Aureliella helgolandensis]QDV24252.1 hypothetical protein Q31a_25670 [Aureliella helgolandensis]
MNPSAPRDQEQLEWLIENGPRLLDATDNQGNSTSPTTEPHGSRLHAWQTCLLRDQRAYRKRAQRRFPQAHHWLWTDRSLAQASDWWTALYKASLFPHDAAVVDACCGAGADLAALGTRGPAVGIDSDPAMVLLAASNVRRNAIDAQTLLGSVPQDIPAGTQWLHVDPDRRPADTRTQVAERFSPPLSDVFQTTKRMRGAVIKLAPSTIFEPQFSEQLDDSVDRVWVGNHGECRQQLLLTGELRQLPPSARAAVLANPESALPASSFPGTVQPLTYVGAPGVTVPIVESPLRFVFDMHAVLYGADLHAAWGEAHGLQALESEAGYFTADRPLSSPWIQCFEVLEVLPWDDRRVRRWLRSQRAGLVEVKNRLHRLDANAYQRKYSQAEGSPVTLLVTRLGGRVRTIAARRI